MGILEDIVNGLRTLGQAYGAVDPDPPAPRPAPAAKPPIVGYDPYPTEDPLEEILLEKSVPCSSCALTIGTNVSTATVRIERSIGALSTDDCFRYDNDLRKRDAGKMSNYQIAVNLSRGLYSSSAEGVATGYCQELTISDADLATVARGGELKREMVRRKRILPLSANGGFSSNTKAIYTLNVPFQLYFSGVATTINPGTGERARKDLTIPISVTHMSLMYPSPFRMGGVQADACLILNDPSRDTQQKAIVIVPLVASPSGGEPSADFVRKLAQYIAVVRDLDPTTGEYPTAAIQTGSSWKLSNLFSLKATDGTKSLVDQTAGATEYYRVANGFYVWQPATQYELYSESETDANAGQEYIRWRWRAIPNDTAPTYLMLDYALPMDSLDLVALTRSLPPTPSLSAVHKIPKGDYYIFHKNAESPARGPGAPVPELKSDCSSDICRESYINYTSTVDWTRAANQIGILEDVYGGKYNESLYGGVDVLAQCPGARCDPFLQGLKKMRLPNHTNVIRIILSVLFLLAIVAGVYLALILALRNYDAKVSSIGETFGQLAAVFARRAQGVVSKAAPVAAPAAPAAPAGPSLLSRLFRPKPVA